jgi:glycosyltransferase involved in cell wall biosynthesis
MQVAVAQLGARMHYAVPRILDQAGSLEHFYTDLYANGLWPRLLAPFTALPGGGRLKSLLERVPEGVDPKKIKAFNGIGLKYSLLRSKAKTPEAQAAAFVWAGEAFCKQLIAQDMGRGTHTFSYNTAGFEWMREARSRGLRLVMEQTIAPKEFELRLMREEQERFPGWEEGDYSEPKGALLALSQREQAEWKQADLILCGSQFVVDGIRACKGPADRCVVVPYGVDAPKVETAAVGTHEGPLRVLTVGAIGLRKGSPTVLEVAKRCKSFAEFRMVGPLTASTEALKSLGEHVALTGAIPRSSIAEQYAWADVFFLPSLCEGSATVTYEALAQGLPVLCTPNSGSVVTDGEDGWLLPAGAAEPMAEKLKWIYENKAALKAFSDKALEKAGNYDTTQYGRRLLQSLERV